MSPLRSFPLLLLVLSWLLGCGSAPAPRGSGLGSMRLAVHLTEALPADVSRLTVTVSASDMASRSTDLALSGDGWGGVLADLPAGAHRTFLAQAFTASNTLRYEGHAEDVTVTADATGLVSLTLQDVSPPPALSNEAPLIDSLVATPATVAPGGQVLLVAHVHDPNPGDSVSYAWSAPSGRFSTPTQDTTSWTAPGTQGPVSLTLTVSDSRGSSLSVGVGVSVSTGSGTDEVRVDFNTAPRAVSLSSSQSVLDVGQQTALAVSATDADGDVLSYQWSATCAGTFTGQGTSRATFTPSALPPAACNNCQVEARLQDGRGGQNTARLMLCVSRDNRHAPPTIERAYQSGQTTRAGQELAFEVEASDPAGSALSFTWTASTGTLGTASTTATGSRVPWTAPACGASGVAPSITVTVSNAFGLKTPQGFTVTGPPVCLPSGWSLTGAMNDWHWLSTATLLPSGGVLVVGGYGYPIKAEVYDPSSSTWRSTTRMLIGREAHTATLLPSGKVLIAGGSSGGVIPTAELYDIATGTWGLTGALAMGRVGHASALLPDGRVLVSGGSNASTYLATAEVYDPATGLWSPTGSMATARSNHTATLLPSGKVLVAGGDANTAPFASAELYDPATGTWSSTGSMARTRSGHTATLLTTGKVLVVGSYEPLAELYDPATGTWSTTGALSLGRSGCTATRLSNGKVLVVGGSNYTPQYTRQKSAELYDPAKGTWTSAGSMRWGREEHAAALLSNGTVLIAGGGVDDNGGLATAELYTP